MVFSLGGGCAAVQGQGFLLSKDSRGAGLGAMERDEAGRRISTKKLMKSGEIQWQICSN